MRDEGNDRVAEFIRCLDWNGVPDVVRQQARLCLLNALGAMLAGTLTPASRIAAETAASLWRGEDATIFLHRLRARAAGAAFANACAAGGSETDDDAIITGGHPGAQLIPAALAVAEERNTSGRALLEALIVGYEVAIRAARCWHAGHESVQASGSWGSLACAAVAARLRGLDHQQVKHALGIADYHAPNAPLARQMRSPAMVKHAAGWGAMNGVVSAELAQRGFTGIPSLLGADDYREWVLDIGEKFWMAGDIFYKDWASGIVECHPGASDQALPEDKFRCLAGLVLPPETIEPLIEKVRQVEDLENVRTITRLITR
jgi:2-methylcitrate dehydratase PrpD